MLSFALFIVLFFRLSAIEAFVPTVQFSYRGVTKSREQGPKPPLLMSKDEEGRSGGLFGGVKNFFEELDKFVDDATSRRLGNGSAFYGKRKSSFYGKDDKNKKQVSGFDAAEDYRGPTQAGYFQWVRDQETGEMVPISKMKGKVLDKSAYTPRVEDE